MQIQWKWMLHFALTASNAESFSLQQERGLIRLSVGVGGPVRVALNVQFK